MTLRWEMYQGWPADTEALIRSIRLLGGNPRTHLSRSKKAHIWKAYTISLFLPVVPVLPAHKLSQGISLPLAASDAGQWLQHCLVPGLLTSHRME